LSPVLRTGKAYRISTLRYNWPMSAHALQAFSMSSVPAVLLV